MSKSHATSPIGKHKRMMPRPCASENPTICGPYRQLSAVCSQMRRTARIADPTEVTAPMQSIQNGSDATCSRDRMVDPSTSEAPDDSGHVMAGSVQVLYTAS